MLASDISRVWSRFTFPLGVFGTVPCSRTKIAPTDAGDNFAVLDDDDLLPEGLVFGHVAAVAAEPVNLVDFDFVSKG